MAIPASTNKVEDFIIFWECEFYSSFTDVNHMCDPSSPSKFPDRPFGSGEPAVWRVRIRSEPGGPGCHVWPGGPPILSCRRTALTICIFGEKQLRRVFRSFEHLPRSSENLVFGSSIFGSSILELAALFWSFDKIII